MSTWYLIPKDDDLMHYGVKGMKWRNRKGPSASNSDNKNPTKKPAYKGGNVSSTPKKYNTYISYINSWRNSQWGKKGTYEYDRNILGLANSIKKAPAEERRKILAIISAKAPSLYKDVMKAYRSRITKNNTYRKIPSKDNTKSVANPKDLYRSVVKGRRK